MAAKEKSKKLVLSFGQTEGKNFNTLYRVYREKLAFMIHEELPIECCFRAGISGRPVPDSFPFVFWKPQALFDRPAHSLARQIMPQIYRLYLCQDTNGSIEYERSLIVAMLRYALWRGHLLWTWELALHLFSKNLYCKEVFSLAALTAAYCGKQELAEWCYDIVHDRSAYFSRCYTILQQTQNFSDRAMAEVRPDASHSFSDKHLLWLEAAFAADKPFEKALIGKIKKDSLHSSNALFDFYAALLCRGYLYDANRLLLRSLRVKDEELYLLQALLNNYLQNGKFWSYLRRLTASSLWPGERAWFESCYAIYSLGLEERLDELIAQLLENKPNPQLPPEKIQENFKRTCRLALGREEYLSARMDISHVDIQFLRNGNSPWKESKALESYDCLDLILDYYLRSSFSKQITLQRRYQFCCQILLNPFSLESGPDCEVILTHCEAIFWTIHTYINRFQRYAIWRLIESLAGRNLFLRALLGIHYFEGSKMTAAKKLLSSVGGLHPVISNLRSEIALKLGRTEEARQIYRRLIQLFPDDLQIQSNYHRLFADRGSLQF